MPGQKDRERLPAQLWECLTCGRIFATEDAAKAVLCEDSHSHLHQWHHLHTFEPEEDLPVVSIGEARTGENPMRPG